MSAQNPPMQLGIQARIVLVGLLPMVLLSLVLVVYCLDTHSQSVNQQLTQTGQFTAAQLALYVVQHPQPHQFAQVSAFGAAQLQQADVQGIHITHKTGQTWLLLGDLTAPTALLFSAPISGLGGQVDVAVSPQRVQQQSQRWLSSVLLALGLGLMLTSVMAWRTGRNIVQPILRMSEAIEEPEQSVLDVSAIHASPWELRRLQAQFQQAQRTLAQQTTAINEQLSETLHQAERQNIELDLARRRAIDANTVKSEFLTNMSHEIRTPLNGIIGFTNLLWRTRLSTKQGDFVQTIQKSSSNLLSIINDILDFSKIESGKLTLEHIDFNLRHCLEDALSILAPAAHEKDLELVLLIYSDVPVKLIGDPIRIKQVMLNLVNNGIKFTPSGNLVVRVMLEDDSMPDKEVLLRMTVTDTGIGIPESGQAELFSAFTQIDSSSTRLVGGTGLGLAITKNLVEQMHGTIAVESQPGEGSTFSIVMPCLKQNSLNEFETKTRLEQYSALLYDSRNFSQLGIYHMLQAWGMPVTALSSLAHIQQHLTHSAGSQVLNYDIIILSLTRKETEPEQIAEILQALRVLQHIPMVALVNTREQAVTQALCASGIQVCLPKPPQGDILYRELVKLIAHDTWRQTPVAMDKQPSFEGLTFLAADDNAINLKLIVTLLRETGATVVEAMDGQEAVKLACSMRYDLIFLDVHMPHFSGVEAAQKIRQHEPVGQRVPMVAMTANALPGTRERLLSNGMDEFILKPISESDLWDISYHLLFVSEGVAEQAVLPTLPVYDLRLALRSTGNKLALAEQFRDKFLQELRDKKAHIQVLYAQEDYVELKDFVHQFHGSAAYCGVPQFKHAAEQLENQLLEAFEQEETACVEHAFAEFSQSIENLLAYFSVAVTHSSIEKS